MKFHVIYGRNGSGKTALSSLFERLQSGDAISVGDVEFELDNGNSISLVGAKVPSISPVPAAVAWQ